ncbi:family 43 glycosylhydrolase [Paenibacillus xerothermodurans]|uniref:Alpha-N-arabinofuranosidase n=1 Tax=Paenibacillus xerothermodurans TaxID=1977292 RepID=A0A2W1NET0_PAEXE|nr:family 43 glycosylhydrolase [Paenibacillus xerothermodurans]PZE22170.1 alpha-N-arabinofuranosidase [Paenibacillus xerothermodurans]
MLMSVLCVVMTMMLAPQVNADKPGLKPVRNFYNVLMQDGADPWMYKHNNGWYYFTKTTGGDVTIWRSRTISGLDAGDSKTVWTPPSEGMYSKNIWAPELHFLDGKWYIYFAADDGRNENHRMYVLENASEDPFEGQWTFKGNISDSTERWAIDGTVLEVGKQRYFLWSGWEGTTNVKQNIYIAKMSNPWTISSERSMIATPTYAWETNTSPQVNEGPQVIIRNGTISLVYSASGSWTDTYCLGLITADITDDLTDSASWTKRDKPIFATANGVHGPGHHSFTKSKDGEEDWIIYHTARWQGAGWTRNIRAQQFTWNTDDTPHLGAPVNPNAPIPLPSGEKPHYRYEAEAAALVNGPQTAAEVSASGGKKVGYIDHADSYVEFQVYAQHAGDYIVGARTGNGTTGRPWAIHTLSVNGGAGSNFYTAYSGWNNWGLSTAKVHLNKGVNTIRITHKEHFAEIDSIDLFPAK